MRMKVMISIAWLAALAACTPPSANSDQGATGYSDAGALDLSGHYRINALGSARLSHSIEVSFDEDSVWWDPRCAGKVMSYSMTGESFTITEKSYTPPPPPQEGEEPSYPPRAICAIGLPTYLPDAIRALEAATQVKRDHHNRLVFSGGQHTLSLSRMKDEGELSPE